MRNVLIAEEKINCFPMPWKHDSTCFNFRCPDEHFRSAEELGGLSDIADIETLVITSDLEDYSFISGMTELRYLYIYSGSNLGDMSFIEDLVCLQHLCLCKTHIASFDPLIRLGEKKYKLFMGSDDLFTRLRYSLCAVYI
ncbi:MAG: hypothetical protein K2K41_06245, partial [Ruminiclostridium sp.]|nr:hypothetical protein [Ruminiclostridium sp.]